MFEDIRESESYKNAHPENISVTAKSITDAQAEYMAKLKDLGKTEQEVMDTHKSVGFEYEFAGYSWQEGESNEPPDSHTTIAKSGKHSQLFDTPFSLETDSGQTLELVTPPLLVDTKNEEGNWKDITKNIYQVYKRTATELMASQLDKSLSSSDKELNSRIGGDWQIDKQFGNQMIWDENSKHQNETYSQMNIGMSYDELELVGSEEEGGEETGAADSLLKQLKAELDEVLEEELADAFESQYGEDDWEKPVNKLYNEVSKSFPHISRGLSNILAIPSVLHRQTSSTGSTKLLHTSIKEVDGFWLKYSPVALLKENLTKEARGELSRFMGDIEEQLKYKIIYTLGSVIDELGVALPKSQDVNGIKKGWFEKSNSELVAMFNHFKELGNDEIDLSGVIEAYIKAGHKFGDESFSGEAAGLGVRKDTFRKIAHPTGKKNYLVELRNDVVIEEYLDSMFT